MSWPLSHEFNEAIQSPQLVFADPDLKTGETVVGATGLPLPRSGNFADVYQLRGADGRDWAVKCFTRPVAGLGDRYAKVSEALAKAALPFSIGFAFLAEGIQIGGVWRPVVKMEWVEGLLLNQVARENAGKPAILTALAQMWMKLCKRLREAGVAHADIQHGNVLLVPGSRAGAYGLKLIDYDGMWVQALANTPSGESGHPSYQHPARSSTRAYSPDVDRFPHLVVATALRGLAVGGSALWERYDNGDNLLFTESDYKKPSDSKLMRELWQTGDPTIQSLVGRLAIACGKPIPQTPWLDQLAPEGDPPPLDDATRREAAAALGISLPVATPLPPEPGFEVVEAPKPVPVPLPVPVAPLPARRAPLTPLVVEAEEELEVDVELVKESKESGKKRPKYRPKGQKSESAGSNTRLWLFAGGGLLLLVGGVVAGVLIGTGKKPAETAQQKEEPKNPSPSPKGPIDRLPPKDKIPNPIGTNPKDPSPDPVGVWTVRQGWTVTPERGGGLNPPIFSLDSHVVSLRANTGDVTILDAETGKLLESPPEFYRDGGVVGLDKGLFFSGTARGPGGTFSIWDPRAGKITQTFPAFGAVYPRGAPSRTAKYFASASVFAPKTFKLKSTQPDQTILNLPLPPDSEYPRIFFTDDESRVLLADRTGKCRWFKLPSGDPAGEWTIEKKEPEKPLDPRFGVRAVSGDGSVLAFWGAVGEREVAVHILDGATGRVLYSIPSTDHPPSLSRDGRLLLVHLAGRGQPESAKLIDLTRKTEILQFSAPPDMPAFRPVLMPNGRGCVATAVGGGRHALIRYDFVAPGAVAVQPPDPAPAGEPLVLKPKWMTPTTEFMHRLYVTASGKVVLGGTAGNRGGIALDTATGAPVAEFADFVKGGAYSFFPLINGRVGKWQLGARTIHFADERTGKEYGQQAVIDVPRAGPSSFPMTTLSPNNQFLATGWTQSGPKFDNQQPLRVFDLRDKGKEVLKLDWPGGSVHFTADSSRVLVAEHTGRCKWYKLPSGEPDGDGWDFGVPAHWRHDITSISADGSVLAYIGLLNGRLTTASIDGKTGAILQKFAIANTTASPVVSADGRRIAIPATERMGFYRVDVADTRTGAIIGKISTGARLISFAFSQDGKTLALAINDPPSVQVFDVPGGGGGVAVVPGPVPGRLEVREDWSADLPADFPLPKLHVTADAKFLGVVSSTGTTIIFDTMTGKVVPSRLDKVAPSTKWHPLKDSRVALGALGAEDKISVVDIKTGQTNSVPGVAMNGMAYQFVSPDTRYSAVGAASSNDPLPFKLQNADRKFILEFDWVRGRVFFTADSSRVLVAEGNGRCRWFKLPSGEKEAEWTLEAAKVVGPSGFRLFACSSDGSILLYDGQLAGHNGAYHVIDGRTGQVIRSLVGPYSVQFGTMSADGTLAILPKRVKGKLNTADVVHLGTGKILAELSSPAANDHLIPSILPDGSGAIALVGKPNKLVRFNFVGAGVVAVGPKPPDPKVPEPDLPLLKEKWSIESKVKLDTPILHFDDDGHTLALVSTVGGVSATAYKPKDGALLRELSSAAVKGQFHQVFGLDKGRFGIQTDVKDILVWDPSTGKITPQTFPAPAAPGVIPYVNFSPDQRYMTVGHARPAPGSKNLVATQLRILSTAGFSVATLDWQVGTTAFTANSSRVLVVDDTDKFRWFKLPSGKADGEWDFGGIADGRNARLMGMSADGEVLLYHGRPPEKQLTVHLLNGKDGTVLHSFPADRYLGSGGAISEDGRQVMLIRNDGAGLGHTVEILDARGGRLAAVKLPQKGAAVAVSWKAKVLAVYANDTRRLIGYELPSEKP